MTEMPEVDGTNVHDDRDDEVDEPQGGRRGWRRVMLYLAVASALLLVAALIAGVLVYRQLDGNLQSDDAFEDILGERPAEVAPAGDREPLDILVVGDDTRAGQTAVGGSTPGLADTTILLHISADRSRAYAVSIPRDLMVSRPRCTSKTDPEQVLPPAGPVMWNAAYSLGGTACLVAQFEQLTDIRVDHFVVVRFESFKEVVDALGGVPVCVPEEFSSAGVTLPAGSYEVSGQQALEYVRNRKDVGDGSDIGRMKRQQAFLAAMAKKATSTGTLVNPVRLYEFLNTATQSLITDPELARLSELVDLGMELRGIGMGQVQMLTMPIAPYAPDPNRVAVGDGADELWRQLREDRPLDERFTSEAITAAEGAPGQPGQAVGTGPDYGLCS